MNFCQWFARCLDIATRTRKHPILGDVPICKRCDENIAALEKQIEARQ